MATCRRSGADPMRRSTEAFLYCCVLLIVTSTLLSCSARRKPAAQLRVPEVTRSAAGFGNPAPKREASRAPQPKTTPAALTPEPAAVGTTGTSSPRDHATGYSVVITNKPTPATDSPSSAPSSSATASETAPPTEPDGRLMLWLVLCAALGGVGLIVWARSRAPASERV